MIKDCYSKYTKNSTLIKKTNISTKKWAKDLKRHLTIEDTHLLEWPKFRMLRTPKAGEDMEQWELSFIAGGNAKWHSHFGR